MYNMINEKHIAKKAYINNIQVYQIVKDLDSGVKINSQDLKEDLAHFTKEEIDYILSNKFNKNRYTNEYCKIQINMDINEFQRKDLLPNPIKIAIRNTKNTGYSDIGMCLDWESGENLDYPFDYIINNYISENRHSHKFKRLNLIFFYTQNLTKSEV